MLFNSQTVHMVSRHVTNKRNKTRQVVRRARQFRFLTDNERTATVNASEPIGEEELGTNEYIFDTEARVLYVGPWAEYCSLCGKEGTLWCCDFSQCAYHAT